MCLIGWPVGSVGLCLRDLLLDALAIEDKLSVASFQVLNLRFQVVVLVDAFFKVAQENRVAEKAVVLLKTTVVYAQSVPALLYSVQNVTVLLTNRIKELKVMYLIRQK